jgi:hypothetical protein
VDLPAGSRPLGCNRVGVGDVDVRRGWMAIGVGDSPEVDLNSVAGGVAVVATRIWPHVKAQTRVEVQRGAEVADGEDGHGPVEHDWEASVRESSGAP